MGEILRTTTPILTPRRFLFIASIGNKGPYRSTRHSAGHILLDAVKPLLPAKIPFMSPTKSGQPAFYQTWSSPSFMNESGPKLTRQLDGWLSTQREAFNQIVQIQSGGGSLQMFPVHEQSPWKNHPQGIDPRELKRFQPTLVILHDELEAPLGRLKVRRGGPQQASLRGHRGLISIMDSLHGKGLLRPSSNRGKGDDVQLSIMRVGVGIGRPESRKPKHVADYVLSELSRDELDAIRAAAEPTVDLLVDELYREEELP
ncbi:peptidyl-tRNA hydrolase, putative [Paecilomyces variotii No. 5]|uniref:Peptidyl-tRNA hydrolase, putative n=1 Tax=Byssochlamys spectabilis (strain No. 5 / NBRC 109023) TaxID=1356009 RepID=V5FJC8_BYSSN|nr:peptidyl-tRNA hydrolase, putative [Paecilomyces variotii No. 5]